MDDASDAPATLEDMMLERATLVEAGLGLAITAADVANYCDHAEHNEPLDIASIRAAGQALRDRSLSLGSGSGADPIELYAARLEAIERRNVLSHDDSLDGARLARAARTWRALQLVQVSHDRAYHPDVAGLAKCDQLRHCALHLAKLAGSTAAVARGEADTNDWLARRVPDMLLFGLKLATLSADRLPEDEISWSNQAAGALVLEDPRPASVAAVA